MRWFRTHVLRNIFKVREAFALITATQGLEEVTLYAAGILDRAALQMAPTLVKLLGRFIKL